MTPIAVSFGVGLTPPSPSVMEPTQSKQPPAATADRMLGCSTTDRATTPKTNQT